MLQALKAKETSVSSTGIFSLKLVPIFICLMLIVGNTTATNSSSGINVPDFWTAAKDFWDFLRSPEESEPAPEPVDEQTQDEQLVNMISDELSTSDDTENLGLAELMHNPICKSVYVADYLPTFNKDAIEKCQKLVEQHETRELLNRFVVELCQQTTASSLTKKQITEIQLRLRKYSLTFPQANFQVNPEDVDGIYGSKTCEYIAHYQIDSQYSVIDGLPDEFLYEQLTNTIPLSQSELDEATYSTPKAKAKPKSVAKPAKQVAVIPKAVTKVEQAPKNSFKRALFCLRYPYSKACNSQRNAIDSAKLELPQR